MLNSVALMGRMVTDPEVKAYSKEGKETIIARYRLVVERDYKVDGEYPADYIMCKAFGPNANYARDYLHKGDLVVVSGRIVTEVSRKPDRENQYFTIIQIERSYLAKKKGSVQAGMFFPENADLPPLPDEMN